MDENTGKKFVFGLMDFCDVQHTLAGSLLFDLNQSMTSAGDSVALVYVYCPVLPHPTLAQT
jgi:hypothetical protein